MLKILTMETEITKIIKDVRKITGLSQTNLSIMVGTPRYNISKYELGITIPPGDILLKLQKILRQGQDKKRAFHLEMTYEEFIERRAELRRQAETLKRKEAL
jgi:transcriptional regulator with XRE-family HTH domain